MAQGLRRWLWVGLIGYAVLFVSWVASPVYRSFRGICPVRPGPIGSAAAIPAFARKYGVSCSQCHTAFPILNAYGRQFKMNGYVRERDSQEGVLQSQDKELWTEKSFPLALILRSRPFDNGRQNVSNAGANFGHNVANGFQFQPIADADMFLAAGDASKHVSAFGEYDAQAKASNSFVPGGGDFSLGYHPYSFVNLIIARRSFFGMDPYQTISDNESPTVANRAVGGFGMPDQGGLSGNLIGELSQTAMVYGQLTKESLGSLYYAAGATSGNSDDLGVTAKNANFRVALDNNQGIMVGGFGTFGHETPATIPAAGGATNTPTVVPSGGGATGPGMQVKYMKAGVDALVEYGDFTARAAAMYIYDHVTNYNAVADALSLKSLGLRQSRDRAAYAEVMYSYKRNDHDYPFLLPLVRENWYTTYNNKRQFNFVTFHLAHYFRPNVKAFVEYSVDTKTDIQGLPNAAPDVASRNIPRGDRGTLQIEVGF